MYCHVTLCDALIALLFIVFPLRYFFAVGLETAGGPQFDYDASIPSVALHSCLSAMLYYRAVITREVITGIYLYT